MKYMIIVHITLILITAGNLSAAEKYNDNWPQWRGPDATGASPNGTPPVEWSESQNIKWKVPIQGKGLSTPVIWDDRIFITTAVELDKKATEEAIRKIKKTSRLFQKILRMSKTTENFIRFSVYCIDRRNGEVLWKRDVREQFPHENIQKNGSWASCSCVTDGEFAIASFGSYGIYCFDVNGNLIWEKDLGDMTISLASGEGASPVIYKDNVIITWDHESQSKLFMLDKRTGDIAWQIERNEVSTWVTPALAEINGITQIILSGSEKSLAYDAFTGKIIWEANGLGEGIIASPVTDGKSVFMMNGFMGSTILAIDLRKAKGTDNAAILWTKDKNASYVPSPLLKDGKLYFLKGTGSKLSCVDAKTGKIFYENQKAAGMGEAYASPVWANGNIYIMDRKGNCSVVKAGEKFKVIAVNRLDDRFDASPAVAGNYLFLRGFKSLYCISD